MTEKFKQMITESSFWQAEKIAGNDDLLREILIWLPVSSLLCFRCVSHHWRSLISDPDFRLLHTRRSSAGATAGLFLFRKSDKRYHLDHLLNISKTTKKGVPYNIRNFIERFKSVEPMNYCNGLLCLKLHLDNNNNNNNNNKPIIIPQMRSGEDREYANLPVLAGRETVSNKLPHLDNDEVIYCVYNPSTNGYTNIPQPNIDDDDEIVAMNLGFDPSKSSNYKIVCIVRDKLELFRFFIFSSDTTIWKESGQVRGDFYFGRGVFLNGVIYFVSKHSHFLYFDLDNESLEIMPSSSVPEGRNGGKIKYFGESAGKLHLIEENVLRPTLLNVFELEKDYSKWFVKYVVDLDDLTHVFPLMVINEPESLDVIGYQFDVLCFIDGEKEGKTILVLSLPEKMISYDIKSMSIKELLKVPLEELHLSMEGFLVYNYKWYHAYKHIETLALV